MTALAIDLALAVICAEHGETREKLYKRARVSNARRLMGGSKLDKAQLFNDLTERAGWTERQIDMLREALHGRAPKITEWHRKRITRLSNGERLPKADPPH